MLEKPALDDEQIIACVRDVYGLAITAIEFLPLGYDANAGVYRVVANGQNYFLKAKSDTLPELSVSLPRYLKDHDFEQVVAPLQTINHDLWGKVGDFTLLLYPFIEEKAGATLSDDQWIEFGRIVRKLHATHLPADLVARMPKEDFVPHPRLLALLKDMNAGIMDRASAHPLENALILFWRERHDDIAIIIDHAERLSDMLRGKSLESVLCHSDIHLGNLLLDVHDKLFIVDWDQPILAPKERDLMFAFWHDEHSQELFFNGYGSVDIDPLVLAFYRYTRLVEDLALFGESVLLKADSDQTKQDAIKWFKWQFESGKMVTTQG